MVPLMIQSSSDLNRCSRAHDVAPSHPAFLSSGYVSAPILSSQVLNDSKFMLHPTRIFVAEEAERASVVVIRAAPGWECEIVHTNHQSSPVVSTMSLLQFDRFHVTRL